ncbi:RNA-guided endonuclease InsQ/TnpB family protein [Brevibacillus sp. SYSU BS000544]|uniref:RNA-guided endonuclease InsQ/TnpB family protein n=1 Tax=Brevibacillus sp. SYSU BS000544 TaxID=3416443 RepID=UPI003CE56E2D
MIRTMKTTFITNSYDWERLFACNRTSAHVWNDCLEIAKQYHLEQGKWIAKTELQKATKGNYALHSQSIQAVCHKYLWSRDNTKKAIDQGISSARYPCKQKKHYNTKWAKDGFKLHSNGKIELSLGNQQGKRVKPIVVWIRNIPQGQVKEIELVFDRTLKVCLSYEDGIQPDKNDNRHTAAIDLGETHSIAAVCENNQALIITGRKLRSIKRLRNKKLAEIQRKMSKCKKYSQQWKKYNRAKQFIMSKSEAQLKDTLHKTTKNFVDWCVKQQVKQVVVGKVEGVQRQTSARKKKNKRKLRTTVSQKLSQWQFGKIKEYLTYKLEAKGVSLSEINEAYSSQTCPVCTRRKKVSGRIYSCPCGYTQHRDIHGASNILSQSLYGVFQQVVMNIQTKYLRVS